MLVRKQSSGACILAAQVHSGETTLSFKVFASAAVRLVVAAAAAPGEAVPAAAASAAAAAAGSTAGPGLLPPMEAPGG